MASYLDSASGRTLVLAAGVCLAGLGLSSLLAASRVGMVVALVSPALALVAAFASVGLGIESHPVQSLAVTIASPLVLWPGFVAAGGLHALGPAMGQVFVAAGVVAMAAFVLMTLKVPSSRRPGAKPPGPLETEP